MINQILSKGNLNKAYLQVYRNKGVGGVDGLEVNDLKTHLQIHGQQYTTAIRTGTYQVSGIKGIEIPKNNGKTRLLGIPTVVDRVFQQAIHQVLQPLFERDFQGHSYGFRPNRNAHQAVGQSLRNINDKYQDIVDIDLKSFFDEVDHSLVLELIYRKVKCRLTMKLIRSFFESTNTN